MLDTSTFLSNTGRSVSEQFFTFASLAAWLLDTFAGASIGPVQEGDDSAAALRRILHAVEAADVEVPTSWTVTRLQTGSGAEVCGLLNALADLALLRSEFACEQPNHSTGDDDACASFSCTLPPFPFCCCTCVSNFCPTVQRLRAAEKLDRPYDSHSRIILYGALGGHLVGRCPRCTAQNAT